MAACAITITGTGKVLLRYTVSAVEKELVASVGTIYLDDATVDANITYTTLTGTAVAASSCFTITELPLQCFHFFWDWFPGMSYTFTKLSIDGDDFALNPVVSLTEETYNALADSINQLDPDKIQAIKGKINLTELPIFSMVIRTLAVNPPVLTAVNGNNTAEFTISSKGGSCSPLGYEDIESCPSSLI